MVLGGVAAGLARHLRVPVLWVRLTFAITAVFGGAGVLAYALLWIFVPPAPDSTTDPGEPRTGGRERRQALGIAAVGLALLIAGTALGLGSIVGWILGPLGLAAVGGAFIWREADDARRARWRRTAVGMMAPSRASMWRLVGGCALVVGGLSVFAIGQLDFGAVRSALVAVLLTLVGVAIITVPWWLRLVRDLGDERRGRVRERERAEIAAHLHDSVLQTLALIQRQSGDSREVLRLARGQERELRTWLYGPAGYASPDGVAGGPGDGAARSTLAAALAQAAGDVEDTYAIAVAPVVVGDAPMDPQLAALVAAAREAMVNAAKHAEVGEVSVYAEVEEGTASVFVRDRGTGFEPTTVGADRRGLAESIRGRMERHGGTALIRSAPGAGTEVELSMPVARGRSTESGDDSHEQDGRREPAEGRR
ncbi:ATP-binding protein [Nakamurella leprariae]|uniref:PspC domain-containing protein n=1 Tax=Nakamurella leprariae TaxID=2803911 RepID=A0A938YBK7_9ACTN|nr:PspC domain-containing protein [Nakamurella leprariae]